MLRRSSTLLLAPIWNVPLKALVAADDVPARTPAAVAPPTTKASSASLECSAVVDSSTFHTPPPSSETVALTEPAATLFVVSVVSIAVCRALW
jgi:hypothetical protein